MYIARNVKKYNNKIYTSVLLRRSYRDKNGKSQKETIANLSSWPDELVDNFEKLLKGGQVVNLNDADFFMNEQGKSYGGIKVILEVAKRLGFVKAFGRTGKAQLILILIAGLVLSGRKSKNYLANHWAKDQAIEEVFNYNAKFDEQDFYEILAYLSKNQAKFEKRIWDHQQSERKNNTVFLYDITSSYVEGSNMDLTEYGYNRDKKKGKKQIVIGLLADENGFPMSVEVFKGNERDFNTVERQLKKIEANFGVKEVVFVGDRGMIKSQQIKQLNGRNWNYITGISRPQIEKLIKDDVIQLEIFDKDLIEVEHENLRYILRRNPIREEELTNILNNKIDILKDFVSSQNSYLTEHSKAQVDVALRKINEKANKLKIEKYISITAENRMFIFNEDIEAKKEYLKLAGCYVLKTDVSNGKLSAKEVHTKYKDLYEIENNFRILKTDFLDIRPIFVRKKEHIKGHVFACMLALMVVKYIKNTFASTEYSHEFIWQTLNNIQYSIIHFKNQKIKSLPDLYRKDQEYILKKLDIKFPKTL